MCRPDAFKADAAIAGLRVQVVIVAYARFDEQRERTAKFRLHTGSGIPGRLPAIDMQIRVRLLCRYAIFDHSSAGSIERKILPFIESPAEL